MKTTIKLILIALVLAYMIFSHFLMIKGNGAIGSMMNGFLIGGLFAWSTQERTKKIYAIALTKPLPHGGTNLQLVITSKEDMEEAKNEALALKEGYEVALILDYTVKL